MPSREEWAKMVEKGYGLPSNAFKRREYNPSSDTIAARKSCGFSPYFLRLSVKFSFLPVYKEMAKRLKARVRLRASQLHVTREELIDSVTMHGKSAASHTRSGSRCFGPLPEFSLRWPRRRRR
jgi:hypothetical protein